MLEHQFGIMFVYVDAVNAVALTIAFLFIMITLYTMVLQRTRDIAILKSSGASDSFIIRQVVAESMLLTAGGTIVGIAMSFLGAYAIETYRPLLTVEISREFVVLGILVAIGGAFLSAVYPAWRATRVDMVEAIAWE
jgi:putative ABC transport system permease protein